jgi:hypothetical protein
MSGCQHPNAQRNNLGLLGVNGHELEPTLDVVQEAEVLVGLGDRENI